MNLNLSKALLIIMFIGNSAFSQTSDFVKYYTRPLTTFYANDFIHTSDDCYVLTGYMTSPFTGGITNYFILKFNNIGDTLWYRQDGSSIDNEGKFVIETSDSCYIVCTNKAQINMVKYDQNGNLLWEKSQNPLPGYSFNFNTLLEVNKKLYAFGTGDLQPAINDVMYKFDLNGDSIMCLFNTPFNSGINRRTAIKYHSDFIAMTGNKYDSSVSNYQATLNIIDTNGSVIFNRIIPTTQSTHGYIIEESISPGFYIYTSPNGFMLKLDSLGNVIWSKDFGIGPLYSTADINHNTFLLMGRVYYYIYLNDSGQLISFNPFDYPYNGSMEVCNMFVNGNKIIMGGAGTDSVTGGWECVMAQFDLSNVTAVYENTESYKTFLYPNPVDHNFGKIFLYSNNVTINKIFMYNYIGEKIGNIDLIQSNKSSIEISIQNLKGGIYFIECFDEKGKRFVKSFVVN